MRFVHTADLHLGALPDAGMPWAAERAEAIRSSLPHIITLCDREAADLLLISGDLFHRQPTYQELKEVNYRFASLQHTRVVLIAGNHDYITPTSPYADFDWAPNVSFLASDTLTSVYFEDLNTEVHGFSYHAREIREGLLNCIHAPADGRIHVLMAHGGDQNHLPLRLTDLAASGYHYVALGHIHQPRIYKDTHIANCGSPEPLEKADTGIHGCILGEVTETGFNLAWHTVASVSYTDQKLVSDGNTTQALIEDHIRAELESAPDSIFRFTITGTRDPALRFDLAALQSLGRISEVIDETEPEYDLEALQAEHAGDMIGHFIRELNTPTATTRMKKALYYGLRALLADESGRS